MSRREIMETLEDIEDLLNKWEEDEDLDYDDEYLDEDDEYLDLADFGIYAEDLVEFVIDNMDYELLEQIKKAKSPGMYRVKASTDAFRKRFGSESEGTWVFSRALGRNVFIQDKGSPAFRRGKVRNWSARSTTPAEWRKAGTRSTPRKRGNALKRYNIARAEHSRQEKQAGKAVDAPWLGPLRKKAEKYAEKHKDTDKHAAEWLAKEAAKRTGKAAKRTAKPGKAKLGRKRATA